MKVADIVIDAKDETGAVILEVYAKRVPLYAIYQTSERVVIQYGDDPAVENTQRANMAQTNAYRTQINGLIDSWRKGSRKATAELYDERVAQAAAVALDGDTAGAAELMSDIKADVLSERTSWARFEYLTAALLAVIVAIAAITFVTSKWFQTEVYTFPAAEIYSLFLAAATGTAGAFFSIALALTSRTILTDLRSRDNTADAILRIAIGAIAAPFLVALLLSGLIKLQLGGATLGAAGMSWLVVMIAAFTAGFSERLVPDLLAKSTVLPANNPDTDDDSKNKPNKDDAAAADAGANAEAPDNGTDQDDEDACLSPDGIAAGEETADSDLPSSA